MQQATHDRQQSGETPKAKTPRRFIIHLLWQEDWTSNPFSKSKYIKGKIVYQKSLNAVQFFSRQFEIHNRNIVIASFEEPAFTSVLPSNDIKALWDLERHTA